MSNESLGEFCAIAVVSIIVLSFCAILSIKDNSDLRGRIEIIENAIQTANEAKE